MSLVGFEVLWYACCFVIAAIFMGASFVLGDRHAWWMLIVACVAMALGVGLAVHVLAVHVDRVT